MQNSYGIAAFRSRQQVLALESALRREGVGVNVVSTPRDVALGCGLSARFAIEDLDKVRRVVRQMRPTNMVGIYRVDNENGRHRLTGVSMHERKPTSV